MDRKLNWKNTHAFLLVLFFVLHGFQENYGFIFLWDVLVLFVTYLFSTALFFIVLAWIYKSYSKAAVMTSALLFFYFFFGAIHDFFYQNTLLKVLSHYILLLPLFLILLLILFFSLKKQFQKTLRINLFISVLLLIYIGIDSIEVVSKALKNDSDKLTVNATGNDQQYTNCLECEKPDIYFLLFDEYASSKALQQQFNYNNTDLDSFLVQHNFHLIKKSFSNYNFTPFSVASILNMSYLKGIKNPKAVGIDDYARCNELIRNNEVIKFLSAQGYEIVNFSIFDLAGNPSQVEQNLLPLKTKLITDRTLFAYLKRDLGWMLFTGRFKIDWLAKDLIYWNKFSNEKFIRLVKEISTQKSQKPRFIYTHLFLPHPPFFYDKNFNLREREVLERETLKTPTKAYLEYIPYTNKQLKDIITTIQQNTERKAVIIFMGDHGFRKQTKDSTHMNFFQNQNAFFFPGNKNVPLYDSVSGVNQFRLVFNELFHQHFPLLKDSTIFLIDK